MAAEAPVAAAARVVAAAKEVAGAVVVAEAVVAVAPAEAAVVAALAEAAAALEAPAAAHRLLPNPQARNLRFSKTAPRSARCSLLLTSPIHPSILSKDSPVSFLR